MQIAIVLYEGMTALDAIGPYEVLRFVPDSEVRFVSNQPGPIVTDSGVLVLGATHSFKETPSPDVVLVPGSEASTVIAMANTELTKWLCSVHENTKFTASVCSGALILAHAGLLKGKPATTHWIAQKYLKTFGVEARRNERIVVAGKIITGSGVSAGIDLAILLVEKLCGEERAKIITLLIEYDPQPMFATGHPSKAPKSVYKVAKQEMLQRAKNVKNMVALPQILWHNVLDKIRGN